MKDIRVKVHNLLLIGAGQLGSRHLQSLAKIDIPVSLQVVDPNGDQLNIARKMFEEIPEHINIKKVQFCTSLRDIAHDIDLCIIATTADVRSETIKRVINTARIKYVIFEKVLFQSLEDYDEVEKLLMREQIASWVNCPRRMYPVYLKMKQYFQPGERLSYHVNGGDWGLACNSIHFIDQVMFLTGMNSYEVDISHLDREIYPSKRKNFIEFSGTLRINYSGGTELVLHSRRHSNSPPMFSILGETCHAVIIESLGKVFLYQTDSPPWSEIQFRIPYQSELTHLAAKEILSRGHCNLTEFGESLKLHKPMLKAFLAHLEGVTGQAHRYCNIT